MRTIVLPSDVDTPAVLRELLDLADHPSDVFYMVGENAVQVPDDLALRWFASGTDNADEEGSTDTVPKKRGRPRKPVEETTDGD